MAILNIETGAAAKAIHVQQIINWLRGIPGFSEPVSFTGISSASTYALNVANTESITGLGLGLRVWNSAISVPLLLVNHAGVTIRPNSNSQSYNFSVRNFANDTDLFKVTEAGVTFSGASPITATNTVTLTNKTLTSPIINTGTFTAPNITDYLNLSQASAPGTPASTALYLYFLNATNDLRYKAGNATERVIVDTASTQTLAGKTLTTPTINTPTIATPSITDYLTIAQNAAPGTPGASASFLYFLTATNDLRYKAGNATERVLVDTSSTQTLAGKILTSPTINAAFINDYLNLNVTTAPGTPSASQAFLYGKTATNDLRFKIAASGTEHILIDDTSTQTLSNKTLNTTTFNAPTFSGPIISNYEDYVQSGATPGTPGAGKARLWMKTDNNAYINVGGVDQTILTSANTSLSSSASYARPLMLGSL